MYIKRLLVLIFSFSLSIGLLACSSYRSELFFRDDHEIADVRFEEIIKALDNKDKKSIKNMFSTNSLKEANDIDSGINYLLEFYNGEVISKEAAYTGKNSTNSNGEKTSELDCMYLVKTDVDEYLVFFIYKIEDTKDPDNIGLYMLQIIKQANRENEFDWGNKIRCAGIYIPAETETAEVEILKDTSCFSDFYVEGKKYI